MAEVRQAAPHGFVASTVTDDPDGVWARWTTPATWGRWNRGLQRAECEGAFVPGATGVVTGVDGRRSRIVVRQVEPRRRVVVELPLFGASMLLTRTLAAGQPATVRHEVTFPGALGRAVHQTPLPVDEPVTQADPPVAW